MVFLIAPLLNIQKDYTKDLVDLESKRSVIQNWVNKIHPRALDKTAKTVKAGLNYDVSQTLQMGVALFITLLFVFHIIFAWLERPKHPTKCKGGPIESSGADVTGNPPVVNVTYCPEDALRIQRLKYIPQTLRQRLIGFTREPNYKLFYELPNVFVPIGMGLLEGESVMKSARKDGITDEAILYDYKQKGFIYGYWRAIMIIVFVRRLVASEAFKNQMTKARSSASALSGSIGANPRVLAMRAKLSGLR